MHEGSDWGYWVLWRRSETQLTVASKQGRVGREGLTRIDLEAEVEVDSSNADTDTVLRGDRAVKCAVLAQLSKQISGYSLPNFPSLPSEAQINSSTMLNGARRASRHSYLPV